MKKTLILILLLTFSINSFADLSEIEAKEVFDTAARKMILNMQGIMDPKQLPKDFYATEEWYTSFKNEVQLNLNSVSTTTTKIGEMSESITQENNNKIFKSKVIVYQDKPNMIKAFAVDYIGLKPNAYYINTNLGKTTNILFDKLINDLSSNLSVKKLAIIEKKLNSKWIKFSRNEYDININKLLNIKNDNMNYSLKDLLTGEIDDAQILNFITFNKYLGEDIYNFRNNEEGGKIYEIPSYVFNAKFNTNAFADYLYKNELANDFKVFTDFKNLNEFKSLINSLYANLEVQVLVDKNTTRIVNIIQPTYSIKTASNSITVTNSSDSYLKFPTNYDSKNTSPKTNRYITIKQLNKLINSK